ncbi:hypothetical protein BJ996_004584 [Streptomyces phaeogriseichromatogenes]|nr:hypothetical protein [Streptomyces murinus]
MGNSPCGKRRVVRGRHTTNAMELVLSLMFRTSPTASKAWEVQLGRMRGLTGLRLCRNRTPGGNSELSVKAHIPFGPRDFRNHPHTKAPPG